MIGRSWLWQRPQGGHAHKHSPQVPPPGWQPGLAVLLAKGRSIAGFGWVLAAIAACSIRPHAAATRLMLYGTVRYLVTLRAAATQARTHQPLRGCIRVVALEGVTRPSRPHCSISSRGAASLPPSGALRKAATCCWPACRSCRVPGARLRDLPALERGLRLKLLLLLILAWVALPARSTQHPT